MLLLSGKNLTLNNIILEQKTNVGFYKCFYQAQVLNIVVNYSG